VRAKDGDLVLADALALLRVVDALALLGRQAQHAELALGLVVVHREGGLADVVEVVGRLSIGLDAALGDQLVGRPRLGIVGEVRRHDALELHPEVPVVVLDHVARVAAHR
jgi:hypothetical protein